MKRTAVSLPSLLPAATAFAHPGHGEPGLLHIHSEWAALGVVVVLAAFIAWRWLRK
jgi:hypothetical protein